MNQPRNFQQLSAIFDLNMRASLTFSSQIGGLADEQDKKIIIKAIAEFSQAFGANANDLEREILGELNPDSDIEDRVLIWDDNDVSIQIAHEKAVSVSRYEFDVWISQNPEKASELIRIFGNLKKQPPMYGELLRQGALTTLVSQFESLLLETIKLYYSAIPSALSAEKSIKLAELRNFSNLLDAERFLVNKEADDLLREGIHKVWKFFEERLKQDFVFLKEHSDDVFEVIGRRNLVIHNNGVIDNEYLNKVQETYRTSRGIELGKRLRVPQKYLLDSIDLMRLVGSALIQISWRKWIKTEHPVADKALMDLSFDTLVDERYELTNKIAKLASYFKIHEGVQKTIVINQAIAFREMGKLEKARKLINSTTWPKKPLTQMAINILREEYDDALQILPRVLSETIETKNLEYRRIRDWPLFKPIRNNAKFVEIFRNHLI